MADVLLAVPADGGQQVQHEEWRPQYDEREEDDAEHFGGLLLQSNDAAVPRGVSRDDARVARVVRPNGGSTLQEARRRRQLVAGFGHDEIRFKLKSLVEQIDGAAAVAAASASLAVLVVEPHRG